ncbi:MAG: phosphoribosylformylglycinamidine synthase subunit PurS [Saprospiraceae bacterium]
MKFVAKIEVMPRPELLDPQGKAVLNNLSHLDIDGVSDVRVGRLIRMELEARDEAGARAQVEAAGSKLLANPIVETYAYTLQSV